MFSSESNMILRTFSSQRILLYFDFEFLLTAITIVISFQDAAVVYDGDVNPTGLTVLIK